MGYRRSAGLASALVCIASLIGMSGSAVAQAGPIPTSTPNASPIPPVLQPPEAPTNFHGIEDGFAWDDNSDNEDGFRLRKTVGFALNPPEANGPIVFAEVAANTTTAPFPTLTEEELCAGVEFSIVAFNGAGESAPAQDGSFAQTDCFDFSAPPTATAAATVVGPNTGAGTSGDGASPATALIAAASAGTLALGAGGVLLRKRASR